MSLNKLNPKETLEQVILINNSKGDTRVLTSKGARKYDLDMIERMFKNFNRCKVHDKFKDEDNNFTFFPICENTYTLLKVTKEEDNIIYHGLIKEGFFDCYPIQYYNCSFFNNFEYNNLSFDDGNLPTVDNLNPNTKISYNKIVRFLMRNSYSGINQSHIRMIKKLINSFLQTIEENKSFVIKDDMYSKVFWIAALQMSISKELAHSITFSLNLNEAKSNLVKIIGFSENNDNLLEVYINQGDKFQIHDLVSGVESKVKYTSEFSKLVQIAYSISLDVLDPFIEFLSKTKYYNFDKEIDNCYDLFKLIDNNFFNAELVEFMRAIDFLDKYSSIEMREEILKILEIRVFNIDEYIEKEVLERLILFIIRTASFNGKEGYFKKAFKLLFQYINNLISTCSYMTVEEIEEYYYDIINKLEISDNYLKEYFLGKENLKRLNEFINNEDIRAVEFYYPIINHISRNVKGSYDDTLILLRKKCENLLEKNFFKFPTLINH